MFHVNKKTEYALLALGYMSCKSSGQDVTNTREIADAHKIPYSLLAKVMQTLASEAFVKAVHGTKGGYILARKPAEITVADAVKVFDGSVAIADCFLENHESCAQWDECFMKDPFGELNKKIFAVLVNTTLADLVGYHKMAPAVLPPNEAIQISELAAKRREES
jgi:Rrf2 family protein